MKEVRSPEFDSQGRLTREFKAGGASQLDAPLVAATNITITTYGTNREADVVIELEQGTYDRQSGVAKSDSGVRIQGKNVVLNGTGMELDPKAEKMTIRGNVKAVLESTNVPSPFHKKDPDGNCGP